jgi:bla regulator protein blaR1
MSTQWKSAVAMLGVMLLASTFWCQEPAFEVASIKPSAPGGRGISINRTPGGRLTTENVSLRFLITFAYDVRDFQVTGGSGWIADARWDISAKPEGEIPQNDDGNLKIRAMVRSLLADRFKLVVHTETREMPVYALIVGKNGAKLLPSPEGSRGPSMRTGRGQLSVTKCPLSLFAQALSNQLGRTVIDQTGMTGDFDFKLEFAPDQNQPVKPIDGHEPVAAMESEGPSVFTAIQEQLGLRLEGRKGLVKIVVIDQAEKATEN